MKKHLLALLAAGSCALWSAAANAIMVRSYLMTFHLHRGALQQCFERAHPTGRTVSIEFHFGSNGRIQRTQMMSSDNPDMAPVARCIATTTRRWRFETNDSGGVRLYEFVFAANEPGPTIRSLR